MTSRTSTSGTSGSWSAGDGTKYPIDAAGHNAVSHLFERGHRFDAAGTREYGYGRAVLWSGCSS